MHTLHVERKTTVCRIFSAIAAPRIERRGYGGPAEALATAGIGTEFFDIVWDDPPTPLRGYGATNPAVFAGSSRAEAPVGAKAGPQAP